MQIYCTVLQHHDCFTQKVFWIFCTFATVYKVMESHNHGECSEVVTQWEEALQKQVNRVQKHTIRCTLAHLIQHSRVIDALGLFCPSLHPINVFFTPELIQLTDQLDHFTSALRQKCIKHISSGTVGRSSSSEIVWAPASCHHKVQRFFHNHISVIWL